MSKTYVYTYLCPSLGLPESGRLAVPVPPEGVPPELLGALRGHLYAGTDLLEQRGNEYNMENRAYVHVIPENALLQCEAPGWEGVLRAVQVLLEREAAEAAHKAELEALKEVKAQEIADDAKGWVEALADLEGEALVDEQDNQTRTRKAGIEDFLKQASQELKDRIVEAIMARDRALADKARAEELAREAARAQEREQNRIAIVEVLSKAPADVLERWEAGVLPKSELLDHLQNHCFGELDLPTWGLAFEVPQSCSKYSGTLTLTQWASWKDLKAKIEAAGHQAHLCQTVYVTEDSGTGNSRTVRALHAQVRATIGGIAVTRVYLISEEEEKA